MDDVTQDRFGAFCPGKRVVLEGAGKGPLAGLTFAAKDNFDVAGFVTGAGSPDWQRAQTPARVTAVAVQRLVDAGAHLVGKTQMDELAYGVLGENAHFGTPCNPQAPDRVPGGSSSGSASAVAAGLVDFALGSDTACSVRLPAALCGLFGIRPTTGRVPTDGMLPLSPSLDTVGWLARTPELLRRVGSVLLDPAPRGPRPTTLLIADDAFALAAPGAVQALQPIVDTLATHFDEVQHVRVGDEQPECGLDWLWFRVWSLQVREVWSLYGDWILDAEPDSKVLCAERFEAAANSTPEETYLAQGFFSKLREAVRAKIPTQSVLCIPSTSDRAPNRNCTQSERAGFARPTLCLTSIAGVAGLPQITLPVARLDGCPIGLSLVGSVNSDKHLLDRAVDLTTACPPLM